MSRRVAKENAVRLRVSLSSVTALVLGALIIGMPGPVRSQDKGAGDAQLRQELDLVKEQLRRVEQQMKLQEELIRKLAGEKPVAAPVAAPGPAPAGPAPSAAGALPAPAPATTTAGNEELRKQIADDIMRTLQPQLLSANKTFASQFNPAIGVIVDSAFSHTRQNKSNFEFRSAELGLSASVDPFARAYAIINGTPDGVDVEEAAIVTTSLPYNLTVKGGRFFADFGRLSKFHDHDLPFVNRPLVLDRFIGGESQSDGVEVSWLAPLSQYLTFTAGAYNTVGADNDRVDNRLSRDISEFTFLGRAATFFSLNDSNSIDLGASDAYTPEVRSEDKKVRNLFGVDLTYRYTPLSASTYRGLIWGSELLVNHEGRPGIPTTDDSPTQVFRYKDAYGLYSYLEAKLTRQLSVGFLFDYVQDIDSPSSWTRGLSPYLTFWASEFQRLRFQYTHLDTHMPARSDDQFFLQWTVVLGSHVHGFRDR
jgi:hypothetical protein